jgi:anti-sigma B factor antagonist
VAPPPSVPSPAPSSVPPSGPAPEQPEDVDPAEHGRIDQRPDAVVVLLTGEIDLHNASTVRQLVHTARDQALADGHPLVIDFTAVTFLASVGLDILAEHRRLTHDTALRTTLVVTGRAVRRPLELTGLTDLFPLRATLADALADTGS